jgi:hypothetical protein
MTFLNEGTLDFFFLVLSEREERWAKSVILIFALLWLKDARIFNLDPSPGVSILFWAT